MRCITTIVALAWVLLAPQETATAATVVVADGAGQPLPGAAVVVFAPSPADVTMQRAVMDQRDERFVPDFLVVSVGAEVSFPNSDQVLHHVYSFSQAKTFELPLYRGMLPSPVRFDREGIVVIGCNIHDHMIGHVWVVSSPIHGLTREQGSLSFDLPAGGYRVQAWHPRAGRDGVKETELLVRENGEGSASMTLPVGKVLVGRGAIEWRDSY